MLDLAPLPFLLEPESAAVLAGLRPYRLPGHKRLFFVIVTLLGLFGLGCLVASAVMLQREPAGALGVVVFIGLPAGWVLYALTLLVRGWAWWREHARIEESPRFLPGRVVRAEAGRSKGGWSVTVAFEFHTPDGRVLEGGASAVRPDLRGQPAPEVGTPVVVAFRSERAFVLM